MERRHLFAGVNQLNWN